MTGKLVSSFFRCHYGCADDDEDDGEDDGEDDDEKEDEGRSQAAGYNTNKMAPWARAVRRGYPGNELVRASVSPLLSFLVVVFVRLVFLLFNMISMAVLGR